MTNPPKKPSEIICERAKQLHHNHADGHEYTYRHNKVLIMAILEHLDSQADAYTTGYNQALKDVQEKI